MLRFPLMRTWLDGRWQNVSTHDTNGSVRATKRHQSSVGTIFPITPRHVLRIHLNTGLPVTTTKLTKLALKIKRTRSSELAHWFPTFGLHCPGRLWGCWKTAVKSYAHQASSPGSLKCYLTSVFIPKREWEYLAKSISNSSSSLGLSILRLNFSLSSTHFPSTSFPPTQDLLTVTWFPLVRKESPNPGDRWKSQAADDSRWVTVIITALSSWWPVTNWRVICPNRLLTPPSYFRSSGQGPSFHIISQTFVEI